MKNLKLTTNDKLESVNNVTQNIEKQNDLQQMGSVEHSEKCEALPEKISEEMAELIEICRPVNPNIQQFFLYRNAQNAQEVYKAQEVHKELLYKNAQEVYEYIELAKRRKFLRLNARVIDDFVHLSRFSKDYSYPERKKSFMVALAKFFAKYTKDCAITCWEPKFDLSFWEKLETDAPEVLDRVVLTSSMAKYDGMKYLDYKRKCESEPEDTEQPETTPTLSDIIKNDINNMRKHLLVGIDKNLLNEVKNIDIMHKNGTKRLPTINIPPINSVFEWEDFANKHLNKIKIKSKRGVLKYLHTVQLLSRKVA